MDTSVEFRIVVAVLFELAELFILRIESLENTRQ